MANVITYRSRSALRDVGKALGHAPEEVDAWSKSVDRGESIHERVDLPPLVRDLATELLDFPRHLGIHSGGMVICDRPVVEVCPVEWGRMPGRSVLQWDKDDCAAAGLVKFDLLGLGMLTALHHMVDLVRQFHGVEIDLARLDQDPAVYDLLCRADTVGVFQVESRAQMNTLPRVQPRCFYDLAIEVALIRPGPIQGNAVHPYIRRRNGTEPITYLHPLLQPALERTLGVPLFQEQLMQIAIDVAGFTPTEADELRQAMSAKRSGERMARLRDRLFAGMAARQVSTEVSEQVYTALAAFANFGFPESHSVAFAHLVYSTAWCKVHYPAAFTAGLLNAQPMGFWSPQSLVADAKRHGVVVRRPDVNAGGADAGLEEVGCAAGAERAESRPGRPSGWGCPRCAASAARRQSGSPRGGPGRAWRTWCAGPASPAPSWRHWPPPGPSTAWGRPPPALPAPGMGRPVPTDAPWCGGPGRPPRPPRTGSRAWSPERTPHPCPGPPRGRGWPTTCGRSGWPPTPRPWSWPGRDWTAGACWPRRRCDRGPTGDRITVGGVVTHRQQPESAHGAVFLNLEDETGMVNIVCSRGAWVRWKPVARSCPALLVRGRIERSEGSMTLVAERFEPLELGPVPSSRDFR